MRNVALGLILMGVSSAAFAQTTTCSTIGNVTNCQHQPQTGPLDYGKMLGVPPTESYESQQLKRAQAAALEIRTRSEQERLSCRKKAMKAIDAGEYEKAKALAALCP